jgi:hypothetical protein
MDRPETRDEDSLTDVERRLAGWQPATGRLDADAMLFAAGRSSARRGRTWLVWPACCLLLALQTAGIAWWGLSERAERVALAQLLREQAVPTNQAPPPDVMADSRYQPSPDDYFHLRQMIEQDPQRLLVSWQSDVPPPIAPPPEPAILTPHARDQLIP